MRKASVKFLKQVERKPNQFEIIFKSLARFRAHFRVEESFKVLFALEVEKI